jgi:hypothetical protein
VWDVADESTRGRLDSEAATTAAAASLW